MGAMRMGQLCEELEAASADPGVRGGIEILEHIAAEFDRVRPALTAALISGST